jgi:pimeloyl-ACP methyl ester carboxylesterase
MRWVGRIFKWLGIGLLGLALMGFAYQQVGNLLDARYRPPVSEFVAVEGHRVHFVCTGAGGARTYLLDSGASFGWDFLVPLLAKSGRVCSVDRPGMGWSDDWHQPHDVVTNAKQIAEIVRVAKMAMPFVYVGHSLGANDAMVYSAMYPRDVAALILIEPGRPVDIREDFHGSRADAYAADECGVYQCVLADIAAQLGVVRLASRLAGAGSKTFPPAMQAGYLAELARPEQVRAGIATLNAVWKSSYEIEDVKRFSVPVLTFASSAPRTPDPGETVADVARWRVAVRAWFASLANASPFGRGPVIVENANHATMVMSPNGSAQVARATLAFLKDAKVP